MTKVLLVTCFIFFLLAEALFSKEINLDRCPSFYNSVGLKVEQDFNSSKYKPEFSYSRAQQFDAIFRYKKMVTLFMQTKDKKECKWLYHYDEVHVFELKCKNSEIDNVFVFNQKNLNIKNIDTKELKKSIKISKLELCSTLPHGYNHREFIESICVLINNNTY